MRKTLEKSKFNNTPEACLERMLDKGQGGFSNFDAYNLNGMFGVPNDI